MQKFVLIVLADAHNGHTGQCNPSVSRIAETTGYSRRAVITALQHLEAKGYIASRKGLGRRTDYELSFQETGAAGALVGADKMAPCKRQSSAARAPVGEFDHPPESAETGAADALVHDVHPCTSDTQLVQEVHTTGAGGAPEPGKNQERNREGEEGAAVVRVGDGWVITPEWNPPTDAIAQARMQGVPQSLIDDPQHLADFRLKYTEAAQRDRAFSLRWVRWMVRLARFPDKPTPDQAREQLDRWAQHG